LLLHCDNELRHFVDSRRGVTQLIYPISAYANAGAESGTLAVGSLLARRGSHFPVSLAASVAACEMQVSP
jgi:hypothetical protein